ncbi:MAG: Ig-like domain-containing protein, partial [Verrucomicrobiota bacterium]
MTVGRPTYKGTTYYAIEYENGRIERGKLAPGETINTIMPVRMCYTVHMYNRASRLYGSAPGLTGADGEKVFITAADLNQDTRPLPDWDEDDLADLAEFVIGSDPDVSDTDDDGIKDGPEVEQGTDPGQQTGTVLGVIAGAPSTGPAEGVCVADGLAVTAEGDSGFTVFNVADAKRPIRVARFDTPGFALAASCGQGVVAIADGSGGCQFANVKDPANPKLMPSVDVGDEVTAVAMNGSVCYAGTVGGELVRIDSREARILGRKTLDGGVVRDLAVARDTLYVLQDNLLCTVRLGDPALEVAYRVKVPGEVNNKPRARLFAGLDQVYATWTKGYVIFDISSDQTIPDEIEVVETNQFGWKKLAPNGTGLGLGTVGKNSTEDGPHDVDVYDLGKDGKSSRFLQTFETTGRAADLAIDKGMAFVADSKSGLQVVRYLPIDRAGVAPTIALQSNIDLTKGVVGAGADLRLTAKVDDDVQVSHVGFFANGVEVAVDGAFPFEYRTSIPIEVEDESSFSVQAVAYDTGGNGVKSENFVLSVRADAEPPTVVGVEPMDASLLSHLSEIRVTFSEKMNPETVAKGIGLWHSGPDRRWDSADDYLVSGLKGVYLADASTYVVRPGNEMASGAYRVVVRGPAADLSGNSIEEQYVSGFNILSSKDSDGDGVPDDWESLLGTRENRVDSNNNGVLDGDEDFDGDGLSNATEIKAGFLPTLADGDGNGVNDGDEDPDFDGLSNLTELKLGTGLLSIDTDGDGLDDATEIATGSDPLNDRTQVRMTVSSPLSSYRNDSLAEAPTTIRRIGVASRAI